MENLTVEGTKYTPSINFDYSTGILEIRGESYPENTTEFYSPVFEWVKQYLDQLGDGTATINIKLIYFNSSSSKILLDFFDMLDEEGDNGKKIVINWFYEEDDEDNQEYGEEFQEDLENVTFNLIQEEI